MNQIDIFDSPVPINSVDRANKGLTKVENGEYIFYPDFLSKSISDEFFKKLQNTIDWKQESMNMYGKKVDFPRLTAWYGDNDKPYTFSGTTLKPNSWTQEILEIKSKIESKANIVFNSVLLNRYRNGNDSISWHKKIGSGLVFCMRRKK